MELSIRQATSSDADALVEIYRPYIEESAASFELEVPSAENFAARINQTLLKHQWLVGIIENQIVGYAYGGPHRARAAYDRSVETSVYLDPKFCGRGIGRKLYARVLDDLSELGFHQAYAGITLPNAASVALHESMQFTSIGIFREVGFKFDQWHDVGWWQRKLSSQ